MAPTLFNIFFSLMLSYVFGSSTEGVYLHIRTDGNMFNVVRLRAKTKVRRVLIWEMLFADDAALATHTEQLMDRISYACKEYGLTIRIKKTNVMGQDVVMPPPVNIDNVTLDVVDSFTYLGSTITSNLPLDAEINIRIAKTATIMSKLNSKVWSNNNLRENTKLRVYQACVLSTLLYSSISWQDRVTNTEVLECAHSSRDVCDGSPMFIGWLTVVYRKISCMTNFSLGRGLQAVHISATKTLASVT